MLAAGLAAVCGGCSMSWQLGSLGKFKDSGEPPEITGSLQPQASSRSQASLVHQASFADAGLAESDLLLARAAAVSVLERGADPSQKDVSQGWENPHTGARGMVTPLASAYADGGLTCRDFLASHVMERSETWLQGEACRREGGRWEVRTLRPWKRS